MKGLFITVEGIEGSGKSTIAERLKRILGKSGYNVLLTREPGGTRISEKLRDLLLDPSNTDIFPLTELFLYLASRAQIVDELIRPALEERKIVICDRFMDASVAYQGWARGLGEELVEQLNMVAVREIVPDITFLLDLPVGVGFERGPVKRDMDGVAERDRLERESLSFHEKVREGYLRLAERHKDRVVIIDASKSIDQVVEAVAREVAQRGSLNIKAD